MKQKFTILFDLDGTLVDTAPDLMLAHNHVMKKFGYPTKSTKDIRNLLSSYNLNLNKNVNSIHFPTHHNKRDRMDYAFITFCDELETDRAKKILSGLRWKNCSLGVLNARENY